MKDRRMHFLHELSIEDNLMHTFFLFLFFFLFVEYIIYSWLHSSLHQTNFWKLFRKIRLNFQEKNLIEKWEDDDDDASDSRCSDMIEI